MCIHRNLFGVEKEKKIEKKDDVSQLLEKVGLKKSLSTIKEYIRQEKDSVGQMVLWVLL